MLHGAEDDEDDAPTPVHDDTLYDEPRRFDFGATGTSADGVISTASAAASPADDDESSFAKAQRSGEEAMAAAAEARAAARGVWPSPSASPMSTQASPMVASGSVVSAASPALLYAGVSVPEYSPAVTTLAAAAASLDTKAASGGCATPLLPTTASAAPKPWVGGRRLRHSSAGGALVGAALAAAKQAKKDKEHALATTVRFSPLTSVVRLQSQPITTMEALRRATMEHDAASPSKSLASSHASSTSSSSSPASASPYLPPSIRSAPGVAVFLLCLIVAAGAFSVHTLGDGTDLDACQRAWPWLALSVFMAYTWCNTYFPPSPLLGDGSEMVWPILRAH